MRTAWRNVPLGVLICGLLISCTGRGRPVSRDAESFRALLVAYAAAAERSDTVALRQMTYDVRGLEDATFLREYYPDVTANPEKAFRDPYAFRVHGDTASLMLWVRSDGKKEFGSLFIRVGGRWRVSRARAISY